MNEFVTFVMPIEVKNKYFAFIFYPISIQEAFILTFHSFL